VKIGRFLTIWLIWIPLLVIMVVFALSNREFVRLEFFPLGPLPFDMPLSVVALIALGVGYFLGGLRVRIAELRYRRAARRAQRSMRLLEAKHQEVSTNMSLAPRA
jgi:putative membrane protein